MIKTLPQLAQALNVTYPTRYSHFTSAQAPPFICYIDDGEENFHADNTILVEGTLINVELYTKNKDLAAESKVKDLFKQNEIPYEKGPTIFIESEGLFLTTFSIKLI
ncbi:hypothetical protein ACPA0F_20265 [Solibacillus silvestris]